MTEPALWYVGSSTIEKFSAVTGAKLATYPGGSTADRYRVRLQTCDVINPDGGVIIYFSSMRYPDDPEYFHQNLVGSDIHVWNSSKRGETFLEKCEYIVPGVQIETRGFVYLYNDVFVSSFMSTAKSEGYNSITGELLWNKTRDVLQMGNGAVGYGKYFYPAITDQCVHAMDIYTGKEVWVSDPAEYPWGCWWAYDAAVAYGKVFFQCYDGHVYAYDAETGDIVWSCFSGETNETPYNTWPFYDDIVVADEMVYAGTTEHSPTQPYYRGQRLYGIDANTGDPVWSISAQAAAKVIADGILVTVDDYTGMLLGFGKGKTATTVSGPDVAVPLGSNVLIKGTVTDESPAQTGTPAIADEDMTAWMEYLHMQKPMPMGAKGVEVKLETLDPNNNFYEIGTVTSDASGFYSLMWEPPVPGKYTIIATFEGSESYWTSYAETAIGVTEAPSPAQLIEPEEPAAVPLITTELGIILAIVAVAAIGLVAFWALRKRK